MSKKDAPDKMSVSEAVAVTRNFGKYLKGMERLQEAADALENSEQVVAENRKAVEAIKAEGEKARKDTEAAKKALAEAQADVETSRKAADQIVKDAKAKADKMAGDAVQRVKDLEAEARQAASEATGARKARDEAVAEETTVNARIQAAKASARAALG